MLRDFLGQTEPALTDAELLQQRALLQREHVEEPAPRSRLGWWLLGGGLALYALSSRQKPHKRRSRLEGG